MIKVWNIAQECWSGSPWDRPSFQNVLYQLDDLASTEGVTPLASCGPKPIQAESLASYLRYIADGDLTSPQKIAQVLANAFCTDGNGECVKDLPGFKIDPQSFIDGLDRVCSCVLSLGALCSYHPGVRLSISSHQNPTFTNDAFER